MVIKREDSPNIKIIPNLQIIYSTILPKKKLNMTLFKVFLRLQFLNYNLNINHFWKIHLSRSWLGLPDALFCGLIDRVAVEVLIDKFCGEVAGLYPRSPALNKLFNPMYCCRIA